ncbi:MAG: hypothetical protein IPH41_09650 [Sulfuritalea sp.]|nr:hypothetical protein [Sulfuritalea sp.]
MAAGIGSTTARLIAHHQAGCNRAPDELAQVIRHLAGAFAQLPEAEFLP